MKNNPNYSSFKSTILFIELRKKLLTKNMKVEDLFTKQVFLRNPKEINQAEFTKISIFSGHNFNILEISDIFNELKYGNTIPINTFIYAYYETDQRYPVAKINIIPDNKQLTNEKREAQKQVLKKALLKLEKYLQESNGLDLFRQVDEQELQYLTPRQFNKLLILTDISQFLSKDVRNLLINSLFSHYKDGKITIEDFTKLFKLKEKKKKNDSTEKITFKTEPYSPLPQKKVPKMPKAAEDKQISFEAIKKKEGWSKEKIPISPIGDRRKIFGNQPQKKNEIPSKNITEPIIRVTEPNSYPEINPKYKIQKPFQNLGNLFKKNETIPEYLPMTQPNRKKKQFPEKSFQNEKFKKKEPFEKNNNLPIPEYSPTIKIPQKQQANNIDEIINVRQIFPSSSHYYRLGTPSIEELSHFQLLEGLIGNNAKYVDKYNPITHIGAYKSSDEIFNGSRYQIFMMAGSVIQREKSRIGVARQIQPKDIMQGQLGDCYLLSSIASIISFYPEVIWEKILFSVNPAHYYVVKLFIDGEWQMITTDDSFPCEYGKPVFAKPHGKQIWVMLLEKCWAKVYKSYRAIQEGTPTQGFRAFTGAPSQYISIQKQSDKTKILQKLEQTFKKRHVATISGSKYLSSLSKDQQQKLGLISDHAYSFLKIIKINGEVIIKMRNPWGKTVWKGDWSFESLKWTKELRNKYNYNNFYEDGSFYICWNDLVKYFTSFVFCKINPTFEHSSLKLELKSDKSTYLRVVVTQYGTYNFSIYQQSKRKHKSIGTYNYDYIPARIVAVKEKNGRYQYINSINKQNSHCTTFQDQLSPGVYIIAIKIQWKNKIYPIVFTSYGAKKVQIQEISSSIAPQLKKGMIQSFSKKFEGKKKYYTNINTPQAYNQSQFSIERGIGYLKMCNPSKREFTSKFSMPKCQGLRIMKPNSLPYQFVMKPNSEYILGFWVSSKGYSYQSSQSLSYKSY